MSASSKKKLRKEQVAAQMTEKQLTEQKEAKKLKLYTTAFTVVIVAMLVFAVYFGVNSTIKNSGYFEKNTVAVTIGDHEVSNAQLNYFFVDAVNNFYSTYGSYASLMGLDMSTPLDQQILDEETGYTWADDFIASAQANAQSVYAMADAAEAAGHSLSAEEQEEIAYTLYNAEAYAMLYGYESTDAYLKVIYGSAASVEGYEEYITLSAMADSYYNAYAEALTYDEVELRAAEAENYAAYSSFDYNYYYLSTSKFYEGGTTDADGNTTYSDDEIAAAEAAAEEAARSLTSSDITTVEEFDAAIAALSVNADTTASSTAYNDAAYTSVNSLFRDWVAADSRAQGDKTYVASTTTSTDENGNETTSVSGYYVVYFNGVNDNNYPLVNARHILVSYTGGTYDSSTGLTTYSDEEKAAAKAEAESILAQWKAGDATEDSFAALANEKSTDGDGTTGGLYEDIYPGQMVTNFNDWCFDESRKTGDTGIVESDYGYHVMYFSGNSDTVYRDFLIENDLLSADLNEWYASVVDAVTVTEGDTKYLSTDLVLSAA